MKLSAHLSLEAFQVALRDLELVDLGQERGGLGLQRGVLHLQSQSSSLLSQINQLQVTQSNLESFKRKVGTKFHKANFSLLFV